MASAEPNNDSNNQQQPASEGDGDATGGGGSASTASSRSSTSSVKSIYIYRNGDKFTPAKKIVLNPRQLREWDVFLEQTTQAVNPIKGAVSTIVTPRRGRQRLNDFEALEDKGHYVALSNGEKFKPMPYVPEDDATTNQNGGYNEAGGGGGGAAWESPGVSPRRNIGNNRVVLEPIRPVVHNKKLMAIQPRFNSQNDVNSIHAKTIRIYRNGDEFTPAILNLLKPSEQVSMEAVLKAIEDRVVLPSNRAIRKLYDMSGKRIWDPKTIDHDKYYVAAGHEPFLARPYGQKLPVLIMGRADQKSSIKYLAQPITPAKESSRRPKDSQRKPANRMSKNSYESNYDGDYPESTRREPDQTGSDDEAELASYDRPPSPRNGYGNNQTQAQKEKAASQIQASLRGFQTRKEAAERQTDKPIAIQSDSANSKASEPPKQKQQQKQETPQQDKQQQKQKQETAQQDKQQQKQKQETPQQKQKQETQQQDKQDKQQQQQQKQETPQREKQQKQDQNQQQKQAASQPTREEQEKAANAIQSSVRGFETRKEVAEKIANKPIEITPDESNSKAAAEQKQKPKQEEQEQQKKEKQTEKKQEKQQPEEQKNQKPAEKKEAQSEEKKQDEQQQKQQPTPQDLDKAATTIQSAYKGYAARQAAAGSIAGTKDSQQQQQQQKQPPKEDKQDPQPQKQLTPEEENAAKNIAAAVNSYKTRKDAAGKEAASAQQQKKQQQQGQEQQQQEQQKADKEPKKN